MSKSRLSEIYVRIFIFFLCINLGLHAVQEATGTDFNAPDYPSFSHIIGQINSDFASDNPLDIIQSYTYWTYELVRVLFGTLTGGFIMSVINTIYPFPDAFTYGVQVILSFLLILTILPYILQVGSLILGRTIRSPI